MKIGFLGSSFDPITNGHIASLYEIASWYDFDKIYLMPSSNKRKDKKMNVSDEHRLAMIELALKDYPNFGIETYEMGVNAWEVQTYKTMRTLREKNPNDELWFLMGADLLRDIANGKWNVIENNWTHVETLLNENKFVVIERNKIDMHDIIIESDILRKYRKKFEFVYKGADNNISSSYVREEYSYGREPRPYMPTAVADYIKEHGLYQKGEEK